MKKENIVLTMKAQNIMTTVAIILDEFGETEEKHSATDLAGIMQQCSRILQEGIEQIDVVVCSEGAEIWHKEECFRCRL